jgi:cytochrome c oxidase cbb3-type subunit 3
VNARLLALAAACIIAGGCDRETRGFQSPPQGAATPDARRVGELQAAAKKGERSASGPYDNNAYAVAQGKRLYVWYNCVGCHAHGGGGMGPALMDEKWIYGHEPHNVFETIVSGRPNGMPAFGDRIPEQQVWQLVAYVRSMSGLLRHDVLPGRSDTLQAVEPELRREELEPKKTGAAVAR